MIQIINRAIRPKTLVELYLGDCLVGLRKLSSESVDLVVTSPPYNLGIKYKTYKDDQMREHHLAWCDEWGREVARVLKPDGALFLNLGGSPSNPYLPHEIAVQFSEFVVLQNTIHWIKAISIEDQSGDVVSRGHFKPITSQRFVNDCHEYVFHFTKTGSVPIDRKAVGVPYTDKSNIGRWGHTGGEDLRCRGNTWFIPYKTIKDKSRERPHPASFPPELAVNCIRLFGNRPGMVMLDPFVGIGSAAIAAQTLGVHRFVGFEIDGEYLEVARKTTGGTVRDV